MPRISVAHRRAPGFIPKATSIAAKQGLRFERSVGKALKALADERGLRLEHNPWFEYSAFRDGDHAHVCVPDFILASRDTILVIECKLTFVPSAIVKLEQIYAPTISRVFPTKRVYPVVIAKSLTVKLQRDCCINALSSALRPGPTPVYLWLGYGQITW